MRVLFISEWYSAGMGYLENRLPRELRNLGAEVEIVTSQAQVYFDSPHYDQIYLEKLGPAVEAPGAYQYDGGTVRRLPMFSVRGRIGMRGLAAAIDGFAPQIVQVLDHSSIAAMQAGLHRVRRRFKLFTSNHLMASVFPPLGHRPPSWSWRARTRLSLWLPGRALSRATEACYVISPDAGDVAHRYLGVPRDKLRLSGLGVDADLFVPLGSRDEDARREKRRLFSASEDEVVCIYTGRLTADKDPTCLARAVRRLREAGLPVRAVFVGSGPLQEDLERIDGCVVLPFQRFEDLPDLYRAADIGVWPREDSTSMFDAKACGIPVVGSDEVRDGRFDEGGRSYREGDDEDLARVISDLLPAAFRTPLGRLARQDVVNNRSWSTIARARLEDYARAAP